jgi:hypothetical protein
MQNVKPSDPQQHPAFEKKSCRTCGYWIMRVDTERCPNCATFHPLRGKHRYPRGSLLRKYLTGGLLGGIAGAGIAAATAWLHSKGWSAVGVPFTAIVSGLFGAGLFKIMSRFSAKANLLSLGVLFGGLSAVLYGLTGSVIPSALWIAVGAWSGHRFMRDSFFAMPKKRLMEFEDQIFHEKVLARAQDRQKAIAEKLESYATLKAEIHERKNEAESESLKTMEQAESVLKSSLASYAALEEKMQLQFLENTVCKWKDNLFEVSDETEPVFRAALDQILAEAKTLEQRFAQTGNLDEVTRAELLEHVGRAKEAARKLEVEVTKRTIIEASKEVSAVPDAHLVDDQLLSPSSEKIQSAYEGFNVDLIDYDVFNELEDAYTRLRVEGELGSTDE